jgi:small-conductance mechanosensitive channel
MASFIESLNISSSPYINALISVLVVVIFAKLADFFVDRVLRRFTKFTKSDIDDKIIDFIHKPVFFTVIILGIVLAISDLRPSPKVLFYSSSFLYSILTALWCVTFIRISNSVIEHGIRKVSDVTGLSHDIIPLAENIAKIVIIIASLMVVLSLWKVNITPLIASAGIAGAAVAFAAKDTIANFFGGISIFVDRPFTIGDYIVLDKGERGEVVAIGVRSTRLRTVDDILITVPNSIIANTKIINESAPTQQFRMRVSVAVAYGSNIGQIEKILLEIAKSNENVLSEPEPGVWFSAFGDSSVSLELLCWAKSPALRGVLMHQLNSAIYKRFGEAGIKIPFPQRDVHLYKT